MKEKDKWIKNFCIWMEGYLELVFVDFWEQLEKELDMVLKVILMWCCWQVVVVVVLLVVVFLLIVWFWQLFFVNYLEKQLVELNVMYEFDELVLGLIIFE